MANILKTSILSSQGDILSSLRSIKSTTSKKSTKKISAIEGDVDIPYFAFEKHIEDREDEIYLAIKEIVLQTIVDLSADDKKETAIIVGTSIIDLNMIETIENTMYDYKRTSYASQKRSIDSYAKDLSDELHLNGFTLSINTACTSSANAILEASNLVNLGIYKYVIVIGLEIFSKMMSSGFYSMQLLADSEIKPFDTQRDGTVLGEAIACLLIGNDTNSWKIKGGFSNCDSMNITTVSEGGDEYVGVMQKALLQTGLKTEDITALKAHATGTPSNDFSEMNAISKVFERDIVFTALKPYIGHTIGACGALEIALFMACIDDGFIPKTINHKKSINPEYQPLVQNKKSTKGIFMFNFFGFGGNNTSLILEKE